MARDFWGSAYLMQPDYNANDLVTPNVQRIHNFTRFWNKTVSTMVATHERGTYVMAHSHDHFRFQSGPGRNPIGARIPRDRSASQPLRQGGYSQRHATRQTMGHDE